LARTITSAEVYQETWLKGAAIFGVVDEQCKDLARFFFSCRNDDGYWIEGDFFSPVLPAVQQPKGFTPSQTTMIDVTGDLSQIVEQIYGEKRDRIPEAVDHFLKNAHTGLKGSWTNSLNAFVFSLTLSRVDETVIWDICEKLAPENLDKRDVYQIKRAIRDGKASV
jgi:hypothetical protein